MHTSIFDYRLVIPLDVMMIQKSGRRINVHRVLMHLESYIKAVFMYSMIKPPIVGVLLVACCPH